MVGRIPVKFYLLKTGSGLWLAGHILPYLVLNKETSSEKQETCPVSNGENSRMATGSKSPSIVKPVHRLWKSFISAVLFLCSLPLFALLSRCSDPGPRQRAGYVILVCSLSPQLVWEYLQWPCSSVHVEYYCAALSENCMLSLRIHGHFFSCMLGTIMLYPRNLLG